MHFSSTFGASSFRRALLICMATVCLILAAPRKAFAVTMSDVQTKMNAYTNWLSSRGYTTNMIDSDRKYCATVFWNADLSTAALKTALKNGDFNTGTTSSKCPRTKASHNRDDGTCTSNFFSNGRQCNGFVCYFWYYLFGTDLEWSTNQSHSVKYSSYAAAGSYLQRGDMVCWSGHYGIVDYVSSSGNIIFFHANGLSSRYPCGIIHGYWLDDGGNVLTTSVLSGSSCYIRRHRDLINNPAPTPVSDCEVYGCSSANGSGTYICTASDGLSINSGHNYSSPTGTVIPYGATVTVTKIASSATYAHVTYGGVSGIASKNFLKPYQPVDECTTYNCVTDYAGYYRVSGTDGSLVLHNAHNYNNSSKIGEISEGTIVWVTKGSTSATYRHVTYGSVQGIMSGNYLKALPKYTLTLNANGGSVSRTSFTVWQDVGDFCDLSGFNPSRSNYTFLGWYTAASGGTQVYNSSGKCVNEGTYWSGNLWRYGGNVTLYAHWQADTVYVENITLSSTSLTLKVNSSASLTATVSPSNATNKNLSWSSSNPSVATVSNGIVQAVSPGTASIFVSAQDAAAASAVCQVTIEVIPVTGITVSSSSVEMNIGDTLPFSVSVTPSNATNQSVVTWIDDESIVSWEGDSIVALDSGVTTIWAQAAENSEIISSCVVTVLPTITDIELSRYSLTLSTDSPGSSFKLQASVIPSDGKGRITWFSSNSAVAVVSDQGEVTAMGAGRATIMASVPEGPSIGCSVTVKDDMPLLNLPSDLTVIGEEAFFGTGAERISIMPATEEIGERAFAGSSRLCFVRIPNSVSVISENAFENDPKLCIVCASGSTAEAYAITHGIDFVTDESAAFVPVRKVSLPAEAELALGETLQLEATVTPAGASNRGIEWQSGNENVAVISAEGLITPLDIGTTVITAAAVDGSGKSSSCTVTVKAPDVKVLASFDTSETQIQDMSAFLSSEIRVEGTADSNIGSAGIIFMEGNGKRLATKPAETCNFENGTFTLSFDTGPDLGIELIPETQYRCRYYVVVCGITFTSNTLTFTTTEGIPRIVIDTPHITLSAGETAILSYHLLYCDDEVVWRSSNSSVAYALDNEIHAVGPGTAKLTARLVSDPSVQAICNVTVE